MATPVKKKQKDTNELSSNVGATKKSQKKEIAFCKCF
jgi:hypothetical protein